MRAVADLNCDRAERLDPAVARHGGRIVNCAGGSVLVEFGSVLDAVECALDLQNAQRDRGRSMALRIGINLCEVIPEGGDIYGDGVNVAFRIEGLAEPGGICITAQAHEALLVALGGEFVESGVRHVKNISRPIRVFMWRREPAGPVPAACQAAPHAPR